MYLKSLNIVNFQAHEELNIDFVDGVNVLFGDSETGKSCIKHAIEFLCMHDTFQGQRRTGTKTTSVKGWFSNGVIVERIISNSINRYILNEDDDNPFNSVGKTAPDEIKEAIGIYPIIVDGEEIFPNSASQVGLPFLFDKSPSFRMKLFNKLTGSDVLDKLFGLFNKDILRIKRNLREEIERFQERATKLKDKKIQKEKAEAIHLRLKKRVENIKVLHEKYSNLLELAELRASNRYDTGETKLKLNNLKFPEVKTLQQLKENIDRYEQVKTVKNGSERLQASLSKVIGQLKAIRVPDFDSATCMGKMNRLYSLENINADLGSTKLHLKDTKIAMKEIEIILKKKEIEYKNLLKEAKVCPICKGDITEDCLKEIKL